MLELSIHTDEQSTEYRMDTYAAYAMGRLTSDQILIGSLAQSMDWPWWACTSLAALVLAWLGLGIFNKMDITQGSLF